MRKEPELATVAGQPVTRAEFDQAHRNQLEQFRQRMGAQFDPAVVDTPFLRQGLLNELINQRLLANVAIDNRFSVSDTTLRNYITKIPTVQANGDFSMELYRQMLAAQGLTMNGFEAGVRRDLAIGRVLEPVGMTARAPAEVVASLETALTQTRTVQLRRFAAADYRSKVDVSPADIQAWYDANKQQLQIPEQVQVQYLVLDEAAATQGVQVKDEDLASYYEQNKTRFGQPERRRVSHIMINLPAGASEDARKAARAKADELDKLAVADPSVRRTGPQGIAGRRLRRQWRRPGLAAEGRAARLAGQGRLRPEQGPGLRRGRKPQRSAHPQADRDPARRDQAAGRGQGPTHRRSAQAARRRAFRKWPAS